jgi:uncharacterized protein YjbI with pentapeptide repeats
MADNHRRGLRKLSPDLIDKASDETAAQVIRIGLTFLATAAFCLLSLLSPDSLLLGGNEKINVPLTGPVSFPGFMLLGPAILIVLRIYLQIYVEHGDRLDRLVQRLPTNRAPTLVPLKNPLVRVFSGLIFYLLLPGAMLTFAWKAAVFPSWGMGLFCVATGVIASHAMLPFRRVSWRSKVLASLSVAFIAGGIFAGRIMLGFEPVRRPFSLLHATLSGQMLSGDDLRDANLRFSNLSGAVLSGALLRSADLTKANLAEANLSGANLTDANLSRAWLVGDNLTDAKLSGANLANANLGGANLTGADLTKAKLTEAWLFDAKLTGANFSEATLTDAYLGKANLTGANLFNANLSRANLTGADLKGARNLTATQLISACSSADPKLPESVNLNLKPCPENPQLFRAAD